MNKDPMTFINHILECIENIESYTKNLTKDNFLNNPMIQDAVIRKLEIIGEAVKNLPESFKKIILKLNGLKLLECEIN